MHITVRRDSTVPLYTQIYGQIRDMIISGKLPAGYLLPSERKLAGLLEVNRSTVVRAYEELKADALIASRAGKRAAVVGSGGDARRKRPEISLIPWNECFNAEIAKIDRSITTRAGAVVPGGRRISFSLGLPAPELFPRTSIKDFEKKALQDEEFQRLLHSSDEGYYPLKETIGRIMLERGVSVLPKDILLTSGSRQGIYLVSMAFIEKGDTLIVEEPSYFKAIEIFRLLGVKLLGVPLDEEGIRTDILARLLMHCRPKMIYTMPTFHNPTGTVMSVKRRLQLLDLAYKYQIPIVEDDPYADLRYAGEDLPTLKALDRYGMVIYIGTMSYVLSPGFKAGWVIAPQRVLKNLDNIKRTIDIKNNVLMEYVIDQFIRSGLYKNHINVVREQYTKRRNAIMRSIDDTLAGKVAFSSPEGGCFIWCSLPEEIPQHRLILNAAKRNVDFASGNIFYSRRQEQNYIRLGFTSLPPDVIEEGIGRLSKAAEDTINGR